MLLAVMLEKVRILAELNNWSETAILLAEIDEDLELDYLRKLVKMAIKAGIEREEVEKHVWYPGLLEVEEVYEKAKLKQERGA